MGPLHYFYTSPASSPPQARQSPIRWVVGHGTELITWVDQRKCTEMDDLQVKVNLAWFGDAGLDSQPAIWLMARTATRPGDRHDRPGTTRRQTVTWSAAPRFLGPKWPPKRSFLVDVERILERP